MIESLEYHIVDHCNLNCAGCSHFSPLAEHWFVDPEDFEKEWKEVADSGLEIKRIRILGGEPLLHPELGYMLKCIRCLFPVSDINVVTNGILLNKRKAELLPVFNKYNISLTVSCYPGLNLDYKDITSGFPKVEMYDKVGFWNISLHDKADFPVSTFGKMPLLKGRSHISMLHNSELAALFQIFWWRSCYGFNKNTIK